jgi:hypothetical protein
MPVIGEFKSVIFDHLWDGHDDDDDDDDDPQ